MIVSLLFSNLSDLQWTIDAYTLPFAVLMLTAGTLGDRFGRKRLFLAGLVLFVLGSLPLAALHQAINQAFVDALHGSFLITGIVMLVTAVLVAGLLWQRQPAARTSAQPEVLLDAPAVNRTIRTRAGRCATFKRATGRLSKLS